ncbi:MAG TPA: TadE/TadG family type IV pilus assembly protein [Sphingomicrobium sp.]|nr:TadE/TadG family type IV pilus assembly protein [Sphingomicrobium sp.]
MRFLAIFRDRRGAAAAEMALVAPLLCAILIGSVELGHFMYNEHILAKSVRDGARYAARQSFANYDCSGEPSTTVRDNTRELVQTMLLSGGDDRMVNWAATTITVHERCVSTVTGTSNITENVSGIYDELALGGAPVVTVSATVPYSPVIGAAFGFSGVGLNLNASQQAAVMGI